MNLQQGGICIFPDIFQRPLHRTRIILFILADKDVLDFVYQSHGIDVRSRDNLPTYQGYPFCETPGGREICQDHIAIQGEQSFVELIFLAGLAGNVKFKFGHINLVSRLQTNVTTLNHTR